jgi:hypothetical protein
MDTQMLEAYGASYAQRKRTGEKLSGSRKKEKDHKTSMHTSLIADDVDMIVTKVEDQLSKVWEDDENNRVSILE